MRGPASIRSISVMGIVVLLLLSFSRCVVQVHASEPSLIEIFSYLGFTNVTETTVETFTAGTYSITLYAEFASHYDENELSHYEVSTSIFNLIFTGPEGGSGHISPPITKTFTADYQFGLSLLSHSYRYFTETSRNPYGQQHAKVYKNLDYPCMFLIGFDERTHCDGTGDGDFNDMVFSLKYTYNLTVSAGVGGWTSPVPGVYPHPCGSSVSVEAIPDSCYVFDHWELDGDDVGSANPYSVLMDDNHTLHAVFTHSPPSLSVSINPPSASIDIGDSISFTSSLSGGESPYSHQWYLDDVPVSGATSVSWTFTPTSTGIYDVYLKVTDACDSTAQSGIAEVTVRPPPGGYSVSLTKPVAKTPLICYTLVLAIFALATGLIRRKRK